MALDASGSTSSDALLERVRKIIPANKYHSLATAHSDGKQRETFTVRQGSGKRERVFRVKVDRPNLEGRLSELSERGYNTRGEIQNMLGIPTDDAVRSHISPVIDFYEGPDGMFVSFEPEFSGAITLRKFVDQKGGKLDPKTFNTVFRQILDAEKASIKYYSLYHRDLHPENILINPLTLEVRITDFTNAALVGETVPKAMPTSGARFMRDPLLHSKFTGVERAYGEDSEMYGLGVLALQLLTGESAVIYDFENGTAVNHDGDSLLDGSGRVIPWKHDSAFVRPTLDIPKNASGHAYWIRSVTAVGDGQGHNRFDSIDQLVEAFDRVTRPTLLDKIKSNRIVVGAVAATTLFLAGGLFGTGWYLDRKIQEKEKARVVAEAEKTEIRPYWNSRGLEISNDVVDLKARLSKGSGETFQCYPDMNKILYFNSEDEVNLTISARANILDVRGGRTCLNLAGQWYIEGYSFEDGKLVKEFNVSTEGRNEGGSYHGQSYSGGFRYAKIPKLSDGVYSLAIELFAPTEKEISQSPSTNLRDAKVRFVYPGKAIVRQRVPFIVGKPKTPIDLFIAHADFFDENLQFRDLSKGIGNFGGYLVPKDGDYTARVYYPDLGISSEGRRWFLPAPIKFTTDRADAYFGVFDNSGNLVNFSGVPLEKKMLEGPYLNDHGREPIFYPTLGVVGPEFAGKLAKFREEFMYRRFDNDKR